LVNILIRQLDTIMSDRFKIHYDAGVAKALHELGSVIAISTYQAGKVIFIGANDDRNLFQVPVSFKKPMGITVMGHRLAVATLNEIQIFSGTAVNAKNYPENPGFYDRLYLPRATYYCGETDLHDLSFGKGRMWGVNTRFSCLSTYDVDFSFHPRWKPPFISKITPEDRCHLNGMAMEDGAPAFVTALSQTDIKEGWRKDITNTGILMKTPGGEIILEGLAMPHSPRIINGELYVLLSASGQLIKVDPKNKKYSVEAEYPAFIRGMASMGRYIFIGMSKIRESSKTFNKLPVSEMSKQAGVIVYDIEAGRFIGEIRYLSTVEEIYDVQIIPGTKRPGMLSPLYDYHRKAIQTKNVVFWKKENDKEEANNNKEKKLNSILIKKK